MLKSEENMTISEFSLLIQDVVISKPAQVQKLARRVGKTYSALVREANPYDSGAKLGAETLMRIMEVSHDIRPLAYMAQRMGMELRKISNDRTFEE